MVKQGRRKLAAHVVATAADASPWRQPITDTVHAMTCADVPRRTEQDYLGRILSCGQPVRIARRVEFRWRRDGSQRGVAGLMSVKHVAVTRQRVVAMPAVKARSLVAPGRVRRRSYSRGMTFERITVDAAQMGGMPCLRGLRIPVATVVAMVADGMTTAEILADLPDLTVEDIAEALRYAAEAVRKRELPVRRPA